VTEAVRVPPSPEARRSRDHAAFAQRGEIDHRAQRPADQPLDLLRPPRRRPRVISRAVRVTVERGSIEYSR